MTEHKPTKAETRDRVLKELRELEYKYPDGAHQDADSLLLELIDDPEITEAFNNIEKWYH